MHKTMYHPKNHLYIDLNLPKLLVIIITIFATLIIPIQLNEYNLKQKSQVSVAQTNTPTVTTGNIAGATTDTTKENQTLGLDASSESAQYFFIGAFFLGISLLIMIYLIADSKKYKDYEFADSIKKSDYVPDITNY